MENIVGIVISVMPMALMVVVASIVRRERQCRRQLRLCARPIGVGQLVERLTMRHLAARDELLRLARRP